MTSYRYLCESDQRSIVEKLRDMIDHPSTEDTVRAVAQKKLEVILSTTAMPMVVEPVTTPIIPKVSTNITQDDLAREFVLGVSIGQLYDNLCSLSPGPIEIKFLRQGQIMMMVPPPFMGLTRDQYTLMVKQACPASNAIRCQYINDKGYLFTISYI